MLERKIVLIAFALFGVIVMGADILLAEPSRIRPGEEKITYIAEDEVGDFKVHIDGQRLLRVFWKEIEILRQWGEIYYPEVEKHEGMRIYAFPNDILVKVKKGRGKAEYRWGYMDSSIGFRQINTVIITPEKIIADSTLEFGKNPPGTILFTPVLFPGEEKRIAGKKCRIIRSNDERYKKVYPKEEKSTSFWWIDKTDTRELIFPLEEGKIRFSFSSTDPSFSACFQGCGEFVTGMGTHRANMKGLVGSFAISPKGSSYKSILHLEIAVGDEVEKKIEEIKEVDLRNDIDIKIESKRLGHIFFTKEIPSFKLKLDNYWTNKDKELSICYRVRDYDNKVILEGKKAVLLKAGKKKFLPLAFSPDRKGIFSLRVDAREGKKIRSTKIIRFAILPEPDKIIPPAKSFFGMNIFSGTGKEIAEFLYNTGVRSVRWMGCNVLWPWVESQEGKFSFNWIDRHVKIHRDAGLDVWFYAHHLIPSWARGEKTYVTSNGSKRPLPKDWKLYENYVYKLVEHFKGRVKIYDIINEPENIPPEVYREFLKAAYKGAKRADPDCVVAGCSVGSLGDENIRWISKVIEEGEGYKYLDAVAFHHYTYPRTFGPNKTAQYPENSLAEKIKKLKAITNKYNLRLWIGETGCGGTYHLIFPRQHFASYDKNLTNWLLRTYLLTMSVPEVEQFSWWPGPYAGSVITNGKEKYAMGVIGTMFLDSGLNIETHAVAHAYLARLFSGTSFKKTFQHETAYMLLFEKNNNPLIALWSAKDEFITKIPIPFYKVKLLDIMGNEKEIEGDDEEIIIELGAEPVYLTGKGIGIKEVGEILAKTRFTYKEPVEVVDIVWIDAETIRVFLRNKEDKPTLIESGKVICGKNVVELGKIEIKEKKTISIKLKIGKPGEDTSVKVMLKIVEKNLTVEKETFYPFFPKALQRVLIAHKAKDPIIIDGKIDEKEWENAKPIYLDRREKVGTRFPVYSRMWDGVDDLSARAYILWDKNYLYFACLVKDNEFANKYTGHRGCWDGDSIQMVLDTLNDARKGSMFDSNDYRIDFAVTEKGEEIYYRTGAGVGKPFQEAKVSIQRKGDRVIYEVALPIRNLKPLVLLCGKVIGFNFIINDDDGQGRIKWIGITDGIAEKKDPSLFKKLIFLER